MRDTLRNVQMCLTTFDFTESLVQRTYHVTPVATFSSIAVEASAYWDVTGIWILLEYSEITTLPVFYCTLCFAC